MLFSRVPKVKVTFIYKTIDHKKKQQFEIFPCSKPTLPHSGVRCEKAKQQNDKHVSPIKWIFVTEVLNSDVHSRSLSAQLAITAENSMFKHMCQFLHAVLCRKQNVLI